MKYLLLLILTFTMAVSASAKKQIYRGSVKTTPHQFEQKGDSLYLLTSMDFSQVEVDSRKTLRVTPIIHSPESALSLPAVDVRGRNDYKVAKRKLKLMNATEQAEYAKKIPYATIKGYKSNDSKQVNYRMTLPYHSWMKESSFSISLDECGCNGVIRRISVSEQVAKIQLESIVMPYQVQVFLAYTQPQAEPIKRREVQREAFLDFKVGSMVILPDYMNNPGELKKITDMMGEIQSDPAITVRGIYVTGYASPEGSLALNQKLSEGRAKSQVDYLLPRYPYAQSMYHVDFGGEDWAGLLKQVEQSGMQYRDEVINIIKNIPDVAKRKKALAQLQKGVPYRYMLKEFYPSLRKAICKVDFVVKGFELAEAKEVFRTRPQNLSLNEMYLVANTYEPGTEEFSDLFETAVRMYPQDAVANLNAAAAALARKDLRSAERYLGNVEQHSPEYNNAMGVWYMLGEDFKNAEVYLRLAADAGLESAKQNLNELLIKQENMRVIAIQQAR